MSVIQEAEVLLAQRLASNEKSVRTKAMKKLRRYIGARSQTVDGGFTGDELLKLWKGLFYCLWMQDKPLLQEDLSTHISSLIHNFQNFDSQLLYFETFLQTFKREWTGIDRLRMDKFYQLIRFMFRKSFEVLQRKNWESEAAGRFLDLLSAQLFHSSSEAPRGLQLHILDLFLTELAVVGSTQLTADQNLMFIKPFCRTAAKTKDRGLLGAICGSIFRAIIDQAPFAIEDLMREVKATEASDSDSGQASEEEEEGGGELKEERKEGAKKMNGTPPEKEEEKEDESEDELQLEELDSDVGPVLQFNYAAVADELFLVAGRSSTPAPNRQKLYKIIKVLRNLSEGIFPQDEYPEEVSTDEDDDMFGSRRRMKRRRRNVKEEKEGPPAAKKNKGEKLESSDEPKEAGEPQDKAAKGKKKKKKKKAKAEKKQSSIQDAGGDQQASQSSNAEPATVTDSQDQSLPQSEAQQPGQSESGENKKKKKKRKKKGKDQLAEPTISQEICQVSADETKEENNCVRAEEEEPKEEKMNCVTAEEETKEKICIRPEEEEPKEVKNCIGAEEEETSRQKLEADSTSAKKKKKKKEAKIEIAEASTIEETPETASDNPTPAEKKKKMEAKIEITEASSIEETPETASDAPTPAEKKKKKKKGVAAEEEVQVNGGSPEAHSEVPSQSTTARKKGKKKGQKEEQEEDATTTPKTKKKKNAEEEGGEEPLAEENNTPAEELPDATTATPTKKRRRKKAEGGDDSLTEESRSTTKKRKIPVVVEVEADELEAQEERERTTPIPDPAEQPTPLSSKKSQKTMKKSTFITFQSKKSVPTPLFCRTKTGTPLSRKKKNQTPKSESKKVTFGLKNNQTAEFKKTDRSLLLSPDGSSRVAFDPQQKPKCGVLKSPLTPLSSRSKTPSSRMSANRPTAADFF